MDTIKTPDDIDQGGRQFFGTAAMTIAAALIGGRNSEPAPGPKLKYRKQPHAK